MNPDPGSSFKELEPPPGGAERFRRRIERRDAPARVPLGRFVVAGLALAAVALVVAIAWHTDDPEPRVAGVYEAPEFDRLLGRSGEPAGLSIRIDDEPSSVSELPSTNARIRIYEAERE